MRLPFAKTNGELKPELKMIDSIPFHTVPFSYICLSFVFFFMLAPTFPDRYKVQSDVVRQLEQKVRDQLQSQKSTLGTTTTASSTSSSSTTTTTSSALETKKQTIFKLERDLERVQAIAQSCRAKVTRQQKQMQQRGDLANTTTSTTTTSSHAIYALQQEQERVQLQLQQDVRVFVPYMFALLFVLLGYFCVFCVVSSFRVFRYGRVFSYICIYNYICMFLQM